MSLLEIVFHIGSEQMFNSSSIIPGPIIMIIHNTGTEIYTQALNSDSCEPVKAKSGRLFPPTGFAALSSSLQ